MALPASLPAFSSCFLTSGRVEQLLLWHFFFVTASSPLSFLRTFPDVPPPLLLLLHPQVHRVLSPGHWSFRPRSTRPLSFLRLLEPFFHVPACSPRSLALTPASSTLTSLPISGCLLVFCPRVFSPFPPLSVSRVVLFVSVSRPAVSPRPASSPPPLPSTPGLSAPPPILCPMDTIRRLSPGSFYAAWRPLTCSSSPGGGPGAHVVFCRASGSGPLRLLVLWAYFSTWAALVRLALPALGRSRLVLGGFLLRVSFWLSPVAPPQLVLCA